MSAGSSAAPFKQSALHLQLKLPCATLDAVCERYGPGLVRGLLFVRTSRPRGEGTLVRLEAQLSDGSPCLRAAATVERAVSPPGLDPGMELKLLAIDEAGRALLERLGGPRLRTLKSEAFAASPLQAAASSPAAPRSSEPPAASAAPSSPAAAHESPATPAPPAAPSLPAVPIPPSAPARSEPILGVDLGGQTAGAAWMEGGVPRVLGLRPLAALGAAPRREVIAEVLRELKRLAERQCGGAVARAVISIPAGASEADWEEARAAAGLAGLTVEALLEETVAAALAFAQDRSLEKNILVYQLGATRFCVALVEVRGRAFTLRGVRVDTALGGKEFDRALAEHLRESFLEQHGAALPDDAAAREQLRTAAERVKVALSEKLEAQVLERFGAMALELAVSRTELVLLTGALVERTLQLCRDLMQELQLRARDLDEVLLVGGQSRMPLLRERLRNLFGVEPSRSIDAKEAVARGAAWLAAELESGAALTSVLVRGESTPAQMHGTPTIAAEPAGAPPEPPAAPSLPLFDPAAETAEMTPARAAPVPRRGWLRNLFGKS